MSTNYATEKVTTAIMRHLMNVDFIPPTTAGVSQLASEITEVVWTELSNAGLSKGAVEHLFAPASAKTKAQGTS
jgi:hypothetical protein